MKTKPIHIDGDLHTRVKATAALSEQSIKQWVEAVLEDALAGRPSPSVLVDSRGRYQTEEAR